MLAIVYTYINIEESQETRNRTENTDTQNSKFYFRYFITNR
jgi:hypothetical protein